MSANFDSSTHRTLTLTARLLSALHLDGALFAGLLAICATGLGIIYSAAGEDVGMFLRQGGRVVLALAALITFAQVPPRFLRMIAPWLYGLGLLLLLIVRP